MIDRWSEEWRHQCEVRTILQWRAAGDKKRCLEHFKAVETQRGKDASHKLEVDVRSQWGRGNKGEGETWCGTPDQSDA